MEKHPYQDMPHLNRCSQWVVAFTPYRGRSFLKRKLLPKDFGHVWAFTEVEGQTMIFDPYNSGYFLACTKTGNVKLMSQSGLGVTPAILATTLLKQGHIKLLKFKAPAPKLAGHWANFLPTCVTMVKLLLGLRVAVFTPRGLYKYMLSNGGEPLTQTTCALFLEEDKQRRSALILQTLNHNDS